jgi:hypothetical protein
LADVVAIVSGGALVAGAVGWGTQSHRLERRRIRAELTDADSSVRAARLRDFGERPLAPYARALVAIARDDPDAQVQDALIALVSRRQWEPLDNAALVELRRRAGELLKDLGPAIHGGPTSLHESTHCAERADFGAGELFAAVEAALGEPVRELRVHVARGTIDVRPLAAAGSTGRPAGDRGVR